MSLFPQRDGAVFSRCLNYRYRLWSIWDEAKPVMNMCLLNPSIAGRVVGGRMITDPTFTRGARRAEMMGMGGVVFTNAYAWVSTLPMALKTAADPVGPENDRHIVEAATAAVSSGGPVVCGWGKECSPERAAALLRLLRAAGASPMALGFNQDGSPQHPLYLKYGLPLLEIATVNAEAA